MKTIEISGCKFHLSDATAERVEFWLGTCEYGCTRAQWWGEIPSAEEDAEARAILASEEMSLASALYGLS